MPVGQEFADLGPYLSKELYDNLVAEKLDDAYGDPQMEHVESLLRQVPSSSRDAAAARQSGHHLGQEPVAVQMDQRRARQERITGQVFVVYGGMVALLAAPVVEQRFDAAGDTWDLPDLDKQLGGFFADRDPSVGFAADSIMQLSV